MKIEEIILCFFIYGFLGWSCEVAFAAVKQRKFINRGFLNGPVCPIYGFGVVSVVILLYKYRNNTMVLFISSVVLVTFLEWLTGLLLERIFHHRWWDYSGLPFNIKGYVCPLFSIIWGVACLIIIKYLHPFVLKIVHWIPEIFVMPIDICLCITFIIDIVVTVTEILKLNLKLKNMKEIAEDMRNLSAYLGDNLSRNVINSIEKQETIKQKIEDYREKYRELLRHPSYTDRRILRAFPKMNSLRYKEQLQELKEFVEKKRTDRD